MRVSVAVSLVADSYTHLITYLLTYRQTDRHAYHNNLLPYQGQSITDVKYFNAVLILVHVPPSEYKYYYREM